MIKVLNKDLNRLALEFDELEVWHPDYSDWLDLDEDGSYEAVDGSHDVPFDSIVSYYEDLYDDPNSFDKQDESMPWLPHGIKRDQIRDWVIDQMKRGKIARPGEPKYLLYV